MKLVVLRHEQRDLLEPRFFTQLTEEGKSNSESLEFNQKIMNINPDVIYCSPFERCLQTISSFCLKNKRQVCVENSLYEYIGNNKFLQEPVYDISNIKDYYEQIINSDYQSYMDKSQFVFSKENNIERLETTLELFNRAADFIEEIFKRHLETNKTILLVSHEGVIKQIETYLYKHVLKISKNYRYIKMGELREFNLEFEN